MFRLQLPVTAVIFERAYVHCLDEALWAAFSTKVHSLHSSVRVNQYAQTFSTLRRLELTELVPQAGVHRVVNRLNLLLGCALRSIIASLQLVDHDIVDVLLVHFAPIRLDLVLENIW